MKLLVVDDEPDILDVLARGLQRQLPGVTVVTAGSGEDAMRLVKGNGYAALLTDERMPGMSGSDLIRWIRTEHPHCRRILMSAFLGADLQDRATEAGAELLLSKPFRLEEAGSRLRAILGPGPATPA